MTSFTRTIPALGVVGLLFSLTMVGQLFAERKHKGDTTDTLTVEFGDVQCKSDDPNCATFVAALNTYANDFDVITHDKNGKPVNEYSKKSGGQMHAYRVTAGESKHHKHMGSGGPSITQNGGFDSAAKLRNALKTLP